MAKTHGQGTRIEAGIGKADSGLAQKIRPGLPEMTEEKVLALLNQAMVFQEKKELKNALKSFLQALNYFERSDNISRQVEVILQIGRLYDRWDVPERAVEYFQRAIIKIKSHKIESHLLGQLYEELAQEFVKLEKSDLAEKNYLDALENLPDKNQETFELEILSQLGQVQLTKRRYQDVLKTNLRMVELHKKGHRPQGLARALNNTGFAYKILGDYDHAIHYFHEALEVETSQKSPEISTLLSMHINLASAYNEQKRFLPAQNELIRALKLAQNRKLYQDEAEIRNYLSLIYYNTQDFQNAHFQSEKAVELSRSCGNPKIRLKAYQTFALTLQKMGYFKEANNFIEQCLELKDSIHNEALLQNREELAKRINIERTEKELKLLLTDSEKSEFELQNLTLEAQKKQQDIELLTKAKELQEISYKTKSLENERALQMSLLQSQKLKADKIIQEMALQQFQTAISAEAFERKNRESKILLLEQEKKLLEKNKTLQQSQLEAQNNRERYFKAIAILIALIFVSVLYGLVQIRLKNQSLNANKKEIEAANRTLAGLNEDIQTKNNSITDSIYYARGIQEAILPEKEKWKSLFPDSFIFYKPKDIVSGDFYFLTQHKNKWFLAFADCTGHGVPGALMSMIGHNLLTSAIEIHGQTDPGAILLEVDKGIQKTLKTQTSHTRDSMELGICIFDFEADQLAFAGSMRSLMVYRNGDLEEWKGDRHPLGTDQARTKNFTRYESRISTIDTIYMFTDGYQDQLGGPEIKRFSSARLKSLLTGAQGKTMPVQEKLIEFTMKDWIADGRQLDDMMVIGIRLHQPGNNRTINPEV